MSRVQYSRVNDCDGSKVLAVNRRCVLANKCIGGTYFSLQMFCALMGLPTPVSKNVYTSYTNQITDKSVFHCIGLGKRYGNFMVPLLLMK